VRYLSRRGNDTDLRDAIKRVPRERRRFDCRCIHLMIAREGFELNHMKMRRIYREEKLQVRYRGGGRQASIGIISRPASASRTALSKASMAN
jgi:putative transposase